MEFDIVFSCYTLDLPRRIKVLKDYGFTEKEIGKITDALRDVTNNIIDHKTGLWRRDYAKVGILEKRYGEIMGSGMGDVEKIYWLVEDCKRYGTLPFAGLARAAFIAVQILQSMVAEGILSAGDYQQFMNDIDTVSSNMGRDFQVLPKAQFLQKYGHQRPGTYDITSKRYDDAPLLYFNWDKKRPDGGGAGKKAGDCFKMTLNQLHKLEAALENNGLRNNVLELMDFIKTVIEGREYGKFIFTKNLSRAMQMVGELGESCGITEEDCSYINIHTIQGMYASTMDAGEELHKAVRSGKQGYEKTKAVTLPPVILGPEDVWGFYYPNTEPNFITLNRAGGDVAVLECNRMDCSIDGKILLIPSADPGFDWIFSHGIKGFFTGYGGANSHMAIRAGELGIPAVIGVGVKQFEKYKAAGMLEIDCPAKAVRVIRGC